jgi:hypothetical protein
MTSKLALLKPRGLSRSTGVAAAVGALVGAPQGAQGAKGDPGTAEFVVSAPIIAKQVIADGQTESWQVHCAPGQVVVSGGTGGDSNYGAGLTFSMSQPLYSNQGWFVQATYNRPSGGPAQVQGYALVSCTPGRSVG